MKVALPLCVCFFSLSFYNCFAQQPKLMLPIGHTSGIKSAIFSPDGKKIVTISMENTIKMWDVVSGKIIANLIGHTSSVNSVQFSLNGKKIVTASADHTVKIWDAASGNHILDLSGHTNEVISASYSPGGKTIITTSKDSTAKLWEASSGKYVIDLMGHNGYIMSVQFSPDGKRIITASGDKTAKIWDAISGKHSVDLVGHSGNIISVQFSPDGKKIITASTDNTATIWDAVSGKQIVDLIGHSADINSIQFSPDGKKIATAALNDYTRIWDAGTGKLIVNIIEQVYWIKSPQFQTYAQFRPIARFSPDGKKIVTTSKYNTVTIWDAASGNFIADLKGHISFVNTVQFSPDGNKILTASEDLTAKIWNAKTGSLITDLKGHTSQINSAQYSTDERKIIIIFTDTTARIWDTASGTLMTAVKGFITNAYDDQFGLEGKKIIAGIFDSTTYIWDEKLGTLIAGVKAPVVNIYSAKFSQKKKIIMKPWDKTATIVDVTTGNFISELTGHTSFIISAEFSPDVKKIVTTSNDHSVKVWDAGSGKLLISIPGHRFKSASFSPDGNKIVTSSSDGTSSHIWDALTGSNTLELKGHTDRIWSAEFSPDGNKIVTTSYDHTAKIWNAATGVILADLKEENGIVSAQFSPNGKKIITASHDHTAKIWDGGNGNHIYTFFAVDSTEYFGQISSGYYQSSPGAAKLLHYVTKDLKVITFEQLDVKYNRPDKVLQAIGSTDTALIKSYRKAYEKRIKKLGIDTTAFRGGYSVPGADFANRDNIDFEQIDRKLKLDITSVDSIYKLDRFNIWVNETPVFGQRGISLTNKNIHEFDTTLFIILSAGENKIETSITNVNGTESYRIPLLVNYTPAVKQIPKTYFIGIGIDQFNDSKYNLKYSIKDIRDLSKKLKEKYTDIIIDTLFNENVTISNVKALKQKLLRTSVNDKVIISYSGHGMLSKDFDYYLSTYAVNFDKPEENGLPYDELESLLDSIPARKKLMFIDACHSGEVDKEDLMAINNLDTSKIKRGLRHVAYKNEGRLGLKNSFELMQSLFVNVGKSTGATIISAAAGTQFALEGVDNLPNGVFTCCILEAMNKYPTMKISELKKIVGERVVELTKGLQKPTSRNETIAVDWQIW